MPPEVIYCSACGAASQPEATFCFHCGQKLLIGTRPTPVTPAPEAPDHLTGLLEPHHMLNQRYRIVELVGKGGMGAVYKARDIKFGRKVAVKEMSQNNLSAQETEEAAERFRQEANLLARLTHPNLPSVYDYFEESGRWYLVMDFIKGETLEEYIARSTNNILPLVEVIDIGIQLTRVLGYLHTRPTPIIFRDLKPLNIMITSDKHVYLIDFGVARLFKRGKAKDTLALGSVGYAAPEQFGKAQTTPRSDIYSLGVILHQLLTGSDPQNNDPLFHFQPLGFYNPALPKELAELLAYTLDVDSRMRPGSMVGVRRELERIRIRLRQPSERSLSSQRSLLIIDSLRRPSLLPIQATPQPLVPSPPDLQLSGTIQISLPFYNARLSLLIGIAIGLFCAAFFIWGIVLSWLWLWMTAMTLLLLLILVFSVAWGKFVHQADWQLLDKTQKVDILH
jgi:serine/threonine protein kinase